MKKALIVEDERLLCAVYQYILENLGKEGKVPPLTITTCHTYKEALRLIDHFTSSGKTLDFCLLDYQLGATEDRKEENGLSVGLEINKVFPECKILVITAEVNNYLFRSILERLKPVGFLIKSDISLKSIQRDFCAVLEGHMVYSKKVMDFIKQSSAKKTALDDRDLKLIHLMDQGYTLPEIGNKIGLSLSGIEYRKRKIANEIGANSSSIPDILNIVKNELKLI